MIEFKDGRFFVAQWFMAGDKVDWLCVVYTDDPAGKASRDWTVHYRFCYRAKADAEDVKNWYRWAYQGSASEVEVIVDNLAETVAAGEKILKTVLRSADAERNLEVLLKESHNHVLPTSPGGDA